MGRMKNRENNKEKTKITMISTKSYIVCRVTTRGPKPERALEVGRECSKIKITKMVLLCHLAVSTSDEEQEVSQKRRDIETERTSFGLTS